MSTTVESTSAESAAKDPYIIRKLANISVKPILSVGNYISLDADCIVAGSTDRTIRFYDTENLEELAKCTMDKKNVSIVAVSGMSPEGDDPIIVTGGRDSILQVWNPTAANSPENVITLPTQEVKSLAVYQGSKTLVVVGTRDAQVIVWDVEENSVFTTCKGHRASVYCVSIAVTTSELESIEDDMNHLVIASGGADRTVRTWDVKTGKKLKKFRHHRSISSIIVTNRGIRPLLATAGVERAIKLWDLTTGILLRSLLGHLDQINSMVLWEGAQMLLISGSNDHTIRIYDMLSGECIIILKGHSDAVLSLTIADADHPKIVSSSEDLSIIQWDLQQIMNDFYYTKAEEDEEKEGMRNDRPVYLPAVEYTAPEELDRNALSKEERRKIRRERKKQKRIKNLQASGKHGHKHHHHHHHHHKKNGEGGAAEGEASSSSKAETKEAADKGGESAKKRGGKEEDDDEDSLKGFMGKDEEDDDLDDLDEDNLRKAAVTTTAEVATTSKEKGDEDNNGNASRRPSINPLLPWSHHFMHSIMKSAVNKVTPYLQSQPPKPAIPPVIQRATFVTRKGGRMTIMKGVSKIFSGNSSSRIGINPADTTANAADGSSAGQSATAGTGGNGVIPKLPEQTEEDYQKMVKHKQERYSQALADQKKEVEDRKSKASEKLQMRLLLKQTNVEDANDPTKIQMMKVKAEKLKQHKEQETRRRMSMANAKNRSAQALQKRLEDLAMKRKQQGEEAASSQTATGESKGGGGGKAGGRGKSSSNLEDVFEEADDGDADSLFDDLGNDEDD